ncbi:MAG: hypothetical protein A3K19_30720 [Lentisphaerae bacterium RIFOXYB12_FULL_65_16]|nr:MAG: hypothetical protein A3K18_04175 [Lentisphaerae bacterium RIFOXYA12_64_32]OGV88792.1 MAG: hypothetical protein A3K19_30720 [Lentisphaerae bacterium RIFOXYB12_FULL_65_16]
MPRESIPARIALISDLHSNLEALQAVLADIRRRGIDEVWCLGDIVGYGPDPVACIRAVRDTCRICILGNHDYAALQGPVDFNRLAAGAIRANTAAVQAADRAAPEAGLFGFLRDLPRAYKCGDFLFVHCSPRDPVGEYVYVGGGGGKAMIEKYQGVFDFVDRYAFCGHTHFPGMIQETERFGLQFLRAEGDEFRLPLPLSGKTIVNIGSVGQPRDGDSRACYVELMPDVVVFHRVKYNVLVTAGKIFSNPDIDDDCGKRLLRAD